MHPLRTSVLLTTLSLSAWAGLPGAAQPTSPGPDRQSAAGARDALHAVLRERALVDQAEDGTIWVRGADYKLSLDDGGATFRVRANRDAPARQVEFHSVQAFVLDQERALSRTVRPSLSGACAVYDRGWLQEVWDFAADGARQSFVLPAAPPAGELTLRIPVAGELCGSDSAVYDAACAPTFVGPDGVAVRYGEWVAFDQRGERLAGMPSLVDGALEIRVPADFLAGASYPVVIDPLVSSDAVTEVDVYSGLLEMSIDESSGICLTVFSTEFGTSDTDVYAVRTKTSGELIDVRIVDIDDGYAINPQVATHEALNKFMIVWEKFNPRKVLDRRVLGRSCFALNGGMGPVIDIRTLHDANHPAIGAPSSSSEQAPFFVAWLEDSLLHDRELAGRTLRLDGSLGPVETLDRRGEAQAPSISSKSGSADIWMVAYSSEVDEATFQANFALVHGSGAVISSENALPLQGALFVSDVDGDGTEFLTVGTFTQADGTGDIFGIRTSLAPSVKHIPMNLSLLELGGGPFLELHQFGASVARTKSGFTYAYLDAETTFSNADRTPFAASLSDALTSFPPFLEQRVALGAAGHNSMPALCNHIQSNQCFAVWSDLDRQVLHQAHYVVP